MSIEFYFTEAALQQKTEAGQGLTFKYYEEETKIFNEVIETKTSQRDEARKITNGKIVFAEKIVPTLDRAEFEPFRLIFEQIQKLISTSATDNVKPQP